MPRSRSRRLSGCPSRSLGRITPRPARSGTVCVPTSTSSRSRRDGAPGAASGRPPAGQPFGGECHGRPYREQPGRGGAHGTDPDLARAGGLERLAETGERAVVEDRRFVADPAPAAGSGNDAPVGPPAVLRLSVLGQV